MGSVGWAASLEGYSASSTDVYLPLAFQRWLVPTLTPFYFDERILITEVYVNPAGAEPDAEWIELFNAGSLTVELDDFKIGDAETAGEDSEGMWRFPAGARLSTRGVIIVANQAAAFYSMFKFLPQYELLDSDPTVPEMEKYAVWSDGYINLNNTGDEILLLGVNDQIVDTTSWGSSSYAFDPPAPTPPEGTSLERYPGSSDTDTAMDWRIRDDPNPGSVELRIPPTETPTPTATQSTTSTPTQTSTNSSTSTVTPTATSSITPTPTPTQFLGVLLISEVLYDPAGNEPNYEWFELYNPGVEDAFLEGFGVGDEEESGGGEGLLRFPSGAVIIAGEVLVIANDAVAFASFYGFSPDYEYHNADPAIPDLIPDLEWGSGAVQLSNSGDELLLVDGTNQLLDALSWGDSNWAFDPPCPDVAESSSLERFPSQVDTDSADDWREQNIPSPGFPSGSNPVYLRNNCPACANRAVMINKITKRAWTQRGG